MAKKYLSLEEAAAALGVKRDELIRLRDKGAIRGFADRGTWKFKGEDVEEFRRQQQPDSSPEVPLMQAKPSKPAKRPDESSILGDNDVVADQPTVIRGDAKGGILDATSDSDVRLIVDDSVIGDGADSDPEVQLPPLRDSDSDVRLVGDRSGKKSGKPKDSDVILTDAGSDSDVQIIGGESDSDVRLVGSKSGGSSSEVILSDSDSDSDVQLVTDEGSTVGRDSDSDVALVSPGKDDTSSLNLPKGRKADSSVFADDSGVTIEADSGSGLTLETDSGISLHEPDSGVAAGDSGISLESVDSGLALETSDSGILIDSGDSGISLESVGDSGISLDDSGSYALSDDSGIEVGSPSDSGIALDAPSLSAKGLGATVPMVGMTAGDDDQGETMLEDEERPIGLKSGKGKGDNETSVILFDDEDDAASAPAAKGKKAPVKAGSSADFDTLESDAFDAGESSEFDEMVDFEDEDLEVAEDVLGDSSADFDEIESLDEMDVFDAADEDFEDSFVAGESESSEFTASAPVAVGRVSVPVEAEWGVPTFVGLVLTTLAMAVCGMVMFDLVRGMWAYNEPMAYNDAIINAVSGMFGK